MKRLDEFRIYYNHTIHPELLRLERKRRRLLLLLFVSALLMIALFIFELYLNIAVLTLFLMIPIGMYITYLLYRIQRFIRTFKPHVVNLILDFIDDGVNYGALEYAAKEFIPVDTFHKSGIFESAANTYQGEDLIRGSIGELNFELCELNVREFSQVRSRLNYVFKGIFLHSTFKDSINGQVYMLPRDFRQYLTRTIRSAVQSGARNVDGLIRSKGFRERFITYATQNAKTKSLLSDQVLEGLVRYTEEYDKDIYLSFNNKKIFIAITEHKNILEPHVFRSNVNFALLREFFEDITLLLQIIEDFDANH